MKSKQEILVEVLAHKLSSAKVGVIVRGITEIDPVEAVRCLVAKNEEKYYLASVGYGTEKQPKDDKLAISNMIEDAVRWRSKTELAGRVIAFVKNDSDKLHSLAEFDIVTTRDLSVKLIDERIEQTLRDFFEELDKRYDEDSEENKDTFPTIGGTFENRPIVLENHNTQFRKIIGTVCNNEAWGGVMITEESVLRDAMFSDYESFTAFVPTEIDSKTSFDGSSLFDFIRRFDEQFEAKKLENVEKFSPILEKLVESRAALLKKLDMIMYFPILAFGASETLGEALNHYMEAWTELLRVYC